MSLHLALGALAAVAGVATAYFSSAWIGRAESRRLAARIDTATANVEQMRALFVAHAISRSLETLAESGIDAARAEYWKGLDPTFASRVDFQRALLEFAAQKTERQAGEKVSPLLADMLGARQRELRALPAANDSDVR